MALMWSEERIVSEENVSSRLMMGRVGFDSMLELGVDENVQFRRDEEGVVSAGGILGDETESVVADDGWMLGGFSGVGGWMQVLEGLVHYRWSLKLMLWSGGVCVGREPVESQQNPERGPGLWRDPHYWNTGHVCLVQTLAVVLSIQIVVRPRIWHKILPPTMVASSRALVNRLHFLSPLFSGSKLFPSRTRWHVCHVVYCKVEGWKKGIENYIYDEA